VFANRVPARFGDLILALLDLGVEELLNLAALHAHEVIVMAALIQLEDRLAAFEMVSSEQPGLLELGEHPIYGGKTDIHAFLHQQPINIVGTHVPVAGVLEEIQYP
jgi:hypothetical protein